MVHQLVFIEPAMSAPGLRDEGVLDPDRPEEIARRRPQLVTQHPPAPLPWTEARHRDPVPSPFSGWFDHPRPPRPHRAGHDLGQTIRRLYYQFYDETVHGWKADRADFAGIFDEFTGRGGLHARRASTEQAAAQVEAGG